MGNTARPPRTTRKDGGSELSVGLTPAPASRLIVYERLRAEIEDGSLGPGTPLREQDIADRYGVSRTPVREAFQRLEAERWIHRDPRVGLSVSAPSAEEVIATMVAQEALEGMAARLAAQRLTDDGGMRLRIVHKELGLALEAGDLRRAVHLSSELHRFIWQLAGNATVYRLLDELELQMGGRMRRSALAEPGRSEEAMREHEELISAILERDPDRAETQMRLHLRTARDVRIEMSIRESTASV